jgi:hypothetical protein
MHRCSSAFIAVLRTTSGGKGFKTSKHFSYFDRPSAGIAAIQPSCSLHNAPSYLQLFPKGFTRVVQFGSVNPRVNPFPINLPMYLTLVNSLFYFSWLVYQGNSNLFSSNRK